MTAPVQTLALQEAGEKKEPAKRWRNTFKLRNPQEWTLIFEGRRVWAKGIAWDVAIYPSKEVAEQAALDWMRGIEHAVEYLGPIPVDENGEPLP
jgi:hypothetical protein